MGVPVVAGDIGGPYMYPSTPPVFASFPMVSGSVRTLVSGRSVMLVGQAQTGGGPISAGTLFSVATLIEGKPVYFVGATTFLSTGWLNGVLQGGGATNTLID